MQRKMNVSKLAVILGLSCCLGIANAAASWEVRQDKTSERGRVVNDRNGKKHFQICKQTIAGDGSVSYSNLENFSVNQHGQQGLKDLIPQDFDSSLVTVGTEEIYSPRLVLYTFDNDVTASDSVCGQDTAGGTADAAIFFTKGKHKLKYEKESGAHIINAVRDDGDRVMLKVQNKTNNKISFKYNLEPDNASSVWSDCRSVNGGGGNEEKFPTFDGLIPTAVTSTNTTIYPTGPDYYETTQDMKVKFYNTGDCSGGVEVSETFLIPFNEFTWK